MTRSGDRIATSFRKNNPIREFDPRYLRSVPQMADRGLRKLRPFQQREWDRSVVLQILNLFVSFSCEEFPERIQNSSRERLSHKSAADYL